MPRNPNRLRHGIGHSRLPSPAMERHTPQAERQRTPVAKPAQHGQSIPVHIVDAFYQMLPSPSIQQQAIAAELRFNASDFSTPDGLVIGNITTRPEQVYVWTDLTFYALIPGDGMASPPEQLDMHQLSGLLKMMVVIDNNDPMSLVTYPECPYRDPLWPDPRLVSGGGSNSGWGTLDRIFGSSRFGSAFALYARSGQQTSISIRPIQTSRMPRFVLDRVGFEIAGYVVSEADFDEVWRRTVGG